VGRPDPGLQARGGAAARRAQTLNYRGLVSVTGNGRFVLVQNATPATSITVVDLAERKVATEVQTPGCWGTLPAGHRARFSMLCGDGKVATVTLDDQGQVADRQLSDKLFDADQDAWFTPPSASATASSSSPSRAADRARPVGPGGAPGGAAAIVVHAAGQAGWRPGGYQAFAVHPGGRWAVVSMHDQGREGSHKVPAKQLWVIDLDSGRRVARLPGLGTASLTFSKSGQRLQALDGDDRRAARVGLADGGKLKRCRPSSPPARPRCTSNPRLTP
jgi:methylamine dehydrogenase heavy chain